MAQKLVADPFGCRVAPKAMNGRLLVSPSALAAFLLWQIETEGCAILQSDRRCDSRFN